MGKNTKTPIKAEIEDGKLIIEGIHEFNLEGLKNLAESIDIEFVAEDLSELAFSIAKIATMAAETVDTDKHVDSSILIDSLPKSVSIYALKVLSDSLKKM
jgi:hypothetical protein